MQKQQQELDRYRSRENEERRRIVKDGMGGDEAMLPPTTIRIPKRSSQDRKSGDGALADDTNVCRVKTVSGILVKADLLPCFSSPFQLLF